MKLLSIKIIRTIRRFRTSKLLIGSGIVTVISAIGICAVWFWGDLSLASFFCDLWGVWNWLRTMGEGSETRTTTIRNLGLLVAGVVALIFAYWRSKVADRQADIARHTLLNERYQRGAEMLGNRSLSVRIGGVYSLEELAREVPEIYHVKVMRVFCAFVRFPTKDRSSESAHKDDATRKSESRRIPADVESVMHAIGYRCPRRISLEQNEKPRVLYLRDANLIHLQVERANFSNAWLTNVNLSDAVLRRTNMSGARLRDADMTCADLGQADLSEAKLWGANLSGTILRRTNLSGSDLCGVDAVVPEHKIPVSGLTQTQLDEAIADSGNPPKLDGAIDAETNEQLIWRGCHTAHI